MPAFTSSTTSRPTRKGSSSGGSAEPLPIDDRALSLDEAVSIAILLQQNEQWTAAADIYRSILEVAPDHADALHYSGVLAHQQARSEQAVALIERSLELEPDRADWHSNLGIVLQDRLRLDEAIVGVPARDRARSESRQRAQQSRCGPEGARQRGRSGSGLSSRHSRRSRALGRVPQPGRPAERPEAAARSGRLLLEGHHAQAEASRSPETAGAGALHARRGRQGGGDLRRMARRRSRTIPLPGTCSRPAPAAMSRRGRRTRSSK